jgi:hypothetical protein
VGEARAGQRLPAGGGVVAGDDQVQVMVRAGMAAKQRINSPAPVQPHHQPDTLELVNDLQAAASITAAVNRGAGMATTDLPAAARSAL